MAKLHWVNARARQSSGFRKFVGRMKYLGEANLWALEMATSHARTSKTVPIDVPPLSYAKWLEAENVDWWQFPARESDRCLTRLRGALVQARDAGDLRSSTASQRMSTRSLLQMLSARIAFHQLANVAERQIASRLKDGFGFEHTLRITTTDGDNKSQGRRRISVGRWLAPISPSESCNP